MTTRRPVGPWHFLIWLSVCITVYNTVELIANR